MQIKLLKFGAQWCGPCKTIKPIIDKLSKEYDIQEIDIDEDHDMVLKYAIKSVPTIVYLKDGVEFNRTIGVIQEKQIRDIISVV